MFRGIVDLEARVASLHTAGRDGRVGKTSDQTAYKGEGFHCLLVRQMHIALRHTKGVNCVKKHRMDMAVSPCGLPVRYRTKPKLHTGNGVNQGERSMSFS